MRAEQAYHYTFSRIPPLKQSSLGVFVELEVQCFSESESEDFKIGMRIADRHAIGTDFCHGVVNHSRFACALVFMSLAILIQTSDEIEHFGT